jgi:hypothetical protein
MGRPRVRRIFPITLSLAEASDATQFSVAELRHYVDLDLLPAYKTKFGRHIVLVEDLVSFIRSQMPRVSFEPNEPSDRSGSFLEE